MIDQRIYKFGQYCVDAVQRRITFSGERLAVTSRSFDVLIALIERAGRVVTKDELMDAVWPDITVEENNLTQQISALRRTFGQRSRDNRFIVTIPGRGYSFVADVSTCDTEIALRESTRPSMTFVMSGVSYALLARIGCERAVLVGAFYALSLMALVGALFLIPLFTTGFHADRHQVIAVIELRSLGGGDDILGAGISETLRARLGTVRDVTVRPLSSRGVSDAITAGRDAHSDIVLTGSVQQEDARVRVTIEMIDVFDGRIVWARTFDDMRTRNFELQDAIAAEVVGFVRPTLPAAGIRSIPLS